MSTIKTNNAQIGQSGTATNNFTLYQPSVPDGTVRLGVGNSGATTSDAVTVTNAGNATLLGNLTVSGTGTSTIGGNLTVSGTGTSAFGGTVTQGGIASERIVQGTAQATTSGSAVGFTGLPSWVKRITVSLINVNVSTLVNGVLQIGSGSYTTSGYTSLLAYVASGTTFAPGTTGFSLYNNSGGAINGVATLVLANSATNTWAYSSIVISGSSTVVEPASGTVSLSGVLDRIQVTAGGGTFSAGTVNIIYEG